MANPFYIEPANPLQALMLGSQAYGEAQLGGGRQRAADALRTGNEQAALAELLGVGATKDITALGHYQQGANSLYGTPVYLQKQDGTYGVGTFDKRGRPHVIDWGPGYSPTVPSKAIDVGTGTVMAPGRVAGPAGPSGTGITTGQPSSQFPSPGASGVYPKDVAGAAREKQYGKEIGDRQAELGKAKAGLDNAFANINRMSDVARNIASDPNLGRITGLQGVFPNWPGGRAADVQARLDNLTSQVGFAVLQAMRDASKTGGALGQVSDFENRQLQNNLAALQRAQSPEQFKAELGKIIQWGDGVKQRLQAAYNQDYGSLPLPNAGAQPTTNVAPPRPTAPKIGEIRDGYRYKGGDPADEANWFKMK